MIKLDLGSAPSNLSNTFNDCLSHAISIFNAHGAGSSELTEALKRGYADARNELHQRQHKKCAYCELALPKAKMPVEHFRPKGKAEDTDQHGSITSTSRNHYWWLTWTWSNLYFSCEECNNKGKKGNKFPIVSGTSRIVSPASPASDPLPLHHFETSTESNLLIDPRTEDPLDHLIWVPIKPALHPNCWVWEVRPRTIKGLYTLAIMPIKERLDYASTHIKVAVISPWNAIERSFQAGATTDAHSSWQGLCQSVIQDQDQPFRAAAWWAIVALINRYPQYSLPQPSRPTVTYP